MKTEPFRTSEERWAVLSTDADGAAMIVADDYDNETFEQDWEAEAHLEREKYFQTVREQHGAKPLTSTLKVIKVRVTVEEIHEQA